MNPFDKIRADRKRFTPKSGFNVVGVDDYEDPGENLYLIGHYKNKVDAEAAAAKHRKDSSDTVHVYGQAE